MAIVKKILMISSRSDLGGGPRYLDDFVTAVQSDFDVYVASPLDSPFGPKFKAMAIEHFALGHRSFSLKTLIALTRFIRKHQISHVYSHGRGAGIYSRLIRLKLFWVTIIHTFHGVHHEKTILGQIKFWFDRFLHPFTQRFIFVSENEKRIAEREGFKIDRPFAIIRPIAPASKIKPSATLSSPIRMGCIARFDHAKGLDLLMDNLVRFQKAHPNLNWNFEIAGDGDRAVFSIPVEVKSRVQLLGPIADPIAFLNTLDIYVAHSRSEGLNLSVLEAISQDVPCLISDIEGHRYYINQQVARGFNLDSQTSFVENLKTMIDRYQTLEPDLRTVFLRKHSQQQVLEQFKKLTEN